MCDASTLGSIAAGAQATGTVASAAGAYSASQGTKAAYAYQAGVSSNNALLAEWTARDAVSRGQVSENRVRQHTAQLASTQRAGMAARGVALDEGSPLSILQDTEFMGNQDALTVRDNAAREAWSARNKAAGFASDSSMLQDRSDSESPLRAAASTFLTGAGTVADSWYKRKQSTSGYY